MLSVFTHKPYFFELAGKSELKSKQNRHSIGRYMILEQLRSLNSFPFYAS